MAQDLKIRAQTHGDRAPQQQHPLMKRNDGLEQENAVLLRLLSESQSTVSKLTARLKDLEAELAAMEASPSDRPARTSFVLAIVARIHAMRPVVIELIRRANAARDARNWVDAAHLYEQAVAINPRNGPIWVQLGNMRKDAGWFDLAADAYAEAAFRMPRSADVQLQIGHLRKLMGDPGGARQAYRRALALDAKNIDASRELKALG